MNLETGKRYIYHDVENTWFVIYEGIRNTEHGFCYIFTDKNLNISLKNIDCIYEQYDNSNWPESLKEIYDKLLSEDCSKKLKNMSDVATNLVDDVKSIIDELSNKNLMS